MSNLNVETGKAMFTDFFENRVGNISNVEQLLNYTPNLFELCSMQKSVFDAFGLENLQRFQKEEKFIGVLTTYDGIRSFFEMMFKGLYVLPGDDFIKYPSNISYEEFKNLFAKILDNLRANGDLNLARISYRYYYGRFREEHKELFIDEIEMTQMHGENRPDYYSHVSRRDDNFLEIIDNFYSGRLPYKTIVNYPRLYRYFNDKKMSNLIYNNMYLVKGDTKESFIDEYTKRYGNSSFLYLLHEFGVKDVLNNICIDNSNNQIEDKNAIKNSLAEAIYQRIVNDKGSYNYYRLTDSSIFREKYPELFVDLDRSKYELESRLYNGLLYYEDVKDDSALREKLKGKNLSVFFKQTNFPIINDGLINKRIGFINFVGNDDFIKLCTKYGKYLYNLPINIKYLEYLEELDYYDNYDDCYTFADMCSSIEKSIYESIISGEKKYDLETAPEFLKEKHPELFLSEDAPEELQNYFYGSVFTNTNNELLRMISKEWAPYVEGKEIGLKAAIIRNISTHNGYMQSYFNKFGSTALKLIVSRPEPVIDMVKEGKLDELELWYNSTGKKFVPDYAVMNNFPTDQINKFLASGSNWSTLMKFDDYTEYRESKDGLLKMAYTFGVFDNDNKGMKKLVDLLTGLPRKIDVSFKDDLEAVENQVFDLLSNIKDIENLAQDEQYEKVLEYLDDFSKSDEIPKYMKLDLAALYDIFKAFKEENLKLSLSEPILTQIYRENEDGSYTLTINPQSKPKSTKYIREILYKIRPVSVVISPKLLHDIASGFDLKYDPDFRDFFLENIDNIMTNPDCINYIPKIQHQFSKIKALNSNLNLTLERAILYIKSNKFENVEIGNEQAATILSASGYSQEDFNVLQEIYNYGKQRVFSSIPRVKNTVGKYTYEMLRLDDPLAMAIGTLTDCCQELNNVAETCMEHSMTSKDGRIFVIKDDEDRPIAQSWVWRNKNTICFDNIEIPNKVFHRASKEGINEEKVTETIYNLYKDAAENIIKKEKEEYAKLLNANKITKEQYDGLRISKVTVGIGYNDIANTLHKKTKKDKHPTRPVEFTPPVVLDNNLYINDSTTQYVLVKEDTQDKKYTGNNLTIYNDDYQIYDQNNITQKDLIHLENLEMATRGSIDYLYGISYNDKKSIISDIAYSYDLDKNYTKVIMNSNFAIIYQKDSEELIIADILYNTKVNIDENEVDIKDKVIMQIRLALEQIGVDKNTIISSLDDEQLNIYKKAMELNGKLDKERGIKHGK